MQSLIPPGPFFNNKMLRQFLIIYTKISDNFTAKKICEKTKSNIFLQKTCKNHKKEHIHTWSIILTSNNS